MSALVPRYGSVTVFAPSATTTGGPELLHQLVHEIRELGGDASVHYYPDPAAATPDRYRGYNIAVRRSLQLTRSDCVVAPETMLRRVPVLTPAKRFVWWLSYDFVQSQRTGRFGRFLANSYKRALIQLLTRFGTRHLFQSFYARHCLRSQWIDGAMLSDYISSAPTPLAARQERRNRVLYNPKKGFEITERLIRTCTDIEFVPLIGMGKDEIEANLRTAKLYIDFGGHPGKDRLPREAALMGAVVIVGRRGSAAFQEDVDLPDRYKLSIDDRMWAAFGPLVQSVFDDFPTHQLAQRQFRHQVEQERATFHRQVREIFFEPTGVPDKG